MIGKLFTNDLYIKVGRNQFEAKNISINGCWESLSSESPFTTSRLLVGHFSTAEPALKKLVTSILPKGIISRRAQVVIQPLSHIDGGLSEVEERIFRELALGAGAIKVALHIGSELTDSEVVKLIAST